MRLVNTTTLCIESLSDIQVSNTPYAILSHAWGPEEVLFHEVQERPIGIEKKAGWKKMASFCAIAREQGFAYAWIDTCCIDKRYSAELEEAITSMFRYYREAAACFIYFEDVKKWSYEKGYSTQSKNPRRKNSQVFTISVVVLGVVALSAVILRNVVLAGTALRDAVVRDVILSVIALGFLIYRAVILRSAATQDGNAKDGIHKLMGTEIPRDQVLTSIRNTRWLSRGWTLQELLAPPQRCFFATDWSEIEDGDDLLNTIAEASGIHEEMLKNRDLLYTFSIAERMKWASRRQTTRQEDLAYSLMGIFNVNIPVLYGEGIKNAFKRLQLEIIKGSFDMTIFAWRADYENSGLLAHSPADFARTPPLELWAPISFSSFAMTNMGMTLRLNIVHEKSAQGEPLMKHLDNRRYIAALQCDVEIPTGQWQVPMIYLEKVGETGSFVNGQRCDAYRRVRCAEWLTLPPEQLKDCPFEDVLVLQDEQYTLFRRATEQYVSRHKIGGDIIRTR